MEWINENFPVKEFVVKRDDEDTDLKFTGRVIAEQEKPREKGEGYITFLILYQTTTGKLVLARNTWGWPRPADYSEYNASIVPSIEQLDEYCFHQEDYDVDSNDPKFADVSTPRWIKDFLKKCSVPRVEEI